MAALEAAERKAAGVGKRRRTERDSDNRASLKKKCVHDLRDLCGELAVETKRMARKLMRGCLQIAPSSTMGAGILQATTMVWVALSHPSATTSANFLTA